MALSLVLLGLVAPPGAGSQLDASGGAVFDHERHTSVDCSRCHTGGGAVPRTDIQWCRSCHHTRGPDSCVACHRAERGSPVDMPTTFNLPGGPMERILDFPHSPHQVRDCNECHGSPPGAVADDFGCAQCHTQHHESTEVDCLQCHEGPPAWAHAQDVVHGGCSGGVCHKRFTPGDPELWAQPVCAACHIDLPENATIPDPRFRAATDTSHAHL